MTRFAMTAIVVIVGTCGPRPHVRLALDKHPPVPPHEVRLADLFPDAADGDTLRPGTYPLVISLGAYEVTRALVIDIAPPAPSSPDSGATAGRSLRTPRC